MTGIRTKHFDLPDHVNKTPKGAYKYLRRVPMALQDTLGVKVWDYSLGSNKTRAYDLAGDYATKHDALIASLASPPARAAHTAKTVAALTSLALVMGSRLGPEDTGVNVTAEVWRQTSAMMTRARGTSDERNRLAMFAAYAFGDLSRKTEADSFGDMLIEHLRPVRPTNPVAAAMFDALKAALAARLAELTPANNLVELMTAYAKTKRPNTRRAYIQKATSLTQTLDFGNHPLTFYTKDRLQEHRDALVAKGVSPASVAQHFNSLKTLWRWSAKEYEPVLFPDIHLPDVQMTIEETRWQAFDDGQIRTVWRLVSEAWGPDADTRMSHERRRAFLMAIRVMLYTGLRPAEVFCLTAGDIKDGVISVRLTKTTGRKIPLSVHIADFPDFLVSGGFDKARSASIAASMSDYFTSIIRAGGFTNDRHVLYSLKDSLIDRLQRQGASDDAMRGIIGHVSGQGKLRHYKTPFGQSPHGMKAMRDALDAITYW